MPHLRHFLQERYGGAKKLKSIWYHGTSPRFLRSILSQGLIPDPKEKAWGEDPEAGLRYPSRASYGGIYVTRSLTKAILSAMHWKQKTGTPETRRYLVVVLSLQPRSLTVDEDDLTYWLKGNFQEASEVAELYFVLHGYGTEDYEKWFHQRLNQYKEAFYGRLRRIFGEEGVDDRLWRVLEPLIEEAWKWAIVRAAAYFTRQYKNRDLADYHWKTYFHRVSGKDPWKNPEDQPHRPPRAEEAERSFAEIIDKIARTLRNFVAKGFVREEPVQTARLLEPVTFRGANRIVAIFELVRPPYPKRSYVVVHYGKLPEETVEALKRGVNPKIRIEETAWSKRTKRHNALRKAPRKSRRRPEGLD